MAEIVMPQLGESVTEGTITRWFKQVGEEIAEDEPLFEVSTDKVDTEVPAPAAGVLTEIRVQEGDTVDVGTVLAVVGDGAAAPAAAPAESEAAPAAAPEAPAPAPAPAPAAPAPAPEPPAPAPAAPVEAAPAPAPAAAPAPAPAPAAAQPPLLSPLVRRLVEEHGIDPASLTGTGVGGRLTRDDVLAEIDRRAAAPSGPAPAPAAAAPAAAAPARPAPAAPAARPAVAPLVPGSGERVEELNKIRRLTGEAMVASKAAAPHAITMVQVDFEGVDRVRRAVRESFRAEEGFSLTYLPFISRAVVDALHEFPHMNASMGDGSVVLHDAVNLSIAVDLDYEGLLAPVVQDAHDKRLRAIARDIHELADRARSKQLGPDDLSGGTFTLSNSGKFGTAMVIPIINQPQVAIMSTDGVSRQPVVITDEFGNESLGIHSVGNLTLSWDHRAFDGAYSAAFMARVKEIIETRDWSAEV
jgi:2-oxoglutarate dehydrogenase E2 component (dihydrolipoamide succinyltransferase)